MRYHAFPSADLRDFLITHSHLEEITKHFPDDLRLEMYEVLFKMIQETEFILFLTITTTMSITDQVEFEGLLRRLVDQLQRQVLGKRKNSSKLPVLTIIETNKDNSTLHAHLLIGSVVGKTRFRNQTDFKHYIQKQSFFSIQRILRKLTYKTAQMKAGKIGKCYYEPVGLTKAELADYLLKGLKNNSLNIAWLATTSEFKKSEKTAQKRFSNKTRITSSVHGVSSRFHRA